MHSSAHTMSQSLHRNVQRGVDARKKSKQWTPRVCERRFSRPRVDARGSRTVTPVLAADFAPPTVAQTKEKFLSAYSKPIPAVYSTVVQELLVQQHFMRYHKLYQYDPIFAVGFVSAFDQICEALTEEQRDAIFTAYVNSLGEDPKAYRKDAQALEQACTDLDGIDGLIPSEDGKASNVIQKTIASISQRVAENNFHYNKFFAIGLFRVLELTGVKEPQALGTLVSAVGVKQEAVNRDLKLYKGILTKLSAAKELIREMMEREKKKAAEKEAEKAEAKSETEANVN